MRVINDYLAESNGKLVFMCPGCDDIHMIRVGQFCPDPLGSPAWTWDGDEDHPTCLPSILVRSGNAQGPTICHSFLEGGLLRFLSDCTHNLAGQTVPISKLPDWILKDDSE